MGNMKIKYGLNYKSSICQKLVLEVDSDESGTIDFPEYEHGEYFQKVTGFDKLQIKIYWNN